MKKKNCPRVMISSMGSGCGKTTMTIAVLSALCSQGNSVQSFKSGPDYIDPMFHTAVTGRKTYNTDAFFMDGQGLCDDICNASDGADISVIEGAMGYYDGIGKTSEGSAYTVAAKTDTPVILIINPQGMGISVAAAAYGYIKFRENSNIRGFLLNKTKPAMYLYYKDILENETGLKVYGYLPDMEDINLKSRHLGLVTSDEVNDLSRITQHLTQTALKTIDIHGIISLANQAPPLIYNSYENKYKQKYRLGIAKDKAFCFYYAQNIDMLERNGAEIIYFSPLKDKQLPENLDGIYIGGGYPEIYIKELSENTSFIESIRKVCDDGIPIYAECGGFMYLQKGICNKDGKIYTMCNILDGVSELGDKLCRFGYITLEAEENTLIADKGMRLKGHEFHYSDSTENGDSFKAVKPDGRNWKAIVSKDNITAGYPHIFFPSNSSLVEKFSRKCLEYKHLKENSD